MALRSLPALTVPMTGPRSRAVAAPQFDAENATDGPRAGMGVQPDVARCDWNMFPHSNRLVVFLAPDLPRDYPTGGLSRGFQDGGGVEHNFGPSTNVVEVAIPVDEAADADVDRGRRGHSRGRRGSRSISASVRTMSPSWIGMTLSSALRPSFVLQHLDVAHQFVRGDRPQVQDAPGRDAAGGGIGRFARARRDRRPRARRERRRPRRRCRRHR